LISIGQRRVFLCFNRRAQDLLLVVFVLNACGLLAGTKEGVQLHATVYDTTYRGAPKSHHIFRSRNVTTAMPVTVLCSYTVCTSAAVLSAAVNMSGMQLTQGIWTSTMPSLSRLFFFTTTNILFWIS
jgi:hypothetical protein